MISKLESRVKKLERKMKDALESGAMVSISSEAGELTVSCEKKTAEEVAKTAINIYEHLRHCRAGSRREVT